MRGLAAFRTVLGTAAWIAPRDLSRLFGVPPQRVTPELEYMNRVFGVAIDLAALGETGHEETLAAAYAAFNRRDLDAAVELMHPEVDWPNAWEGGRVRGRAAVRSYWERQFEEISSRVEPLHFTEEPDGSITVAVHQVVHDLRSGELLTDSQVRHRYRLDDGLIVQMDVLEP